MQRPPKQLGLNDSPSLTAAVASGAGDRAAAALPSAMTDWFGMIASVGCAIHCAAMPFVVSFLPMLGLSFLADEAFHKVMVGVCLLIAVAAFVPGWRKHRRWLPMAIASVGLAMIATAAFALEDTCCSACSACSPPTTTAPWLMWVTPLGGLVLVTAHLTNHRFVCRCGCCPAPSVRTRIGN